MDHSFLLILTRSLSFTFVVTIFNHGSFSIALNNYHQSIPPEQKAIQRVSAWRLSPECGIVPEVVSVIGFCAQPDPTELSLPEYDDVKWWNSSSRGTLMGIALGNVNESFWRNTERSDSDYTDLFVGDRMANLPDAIRDVFGQPWYYRSLVDLVGKPLMAGGPDESHLTLHTHGISARADIWFNGHLVANSSTQAGSYAGQTYDLTPYLHDNASSHHEMEGSLAITATPKVLLIKVYPTDTMRDLAIGFVDWNPAPPDNGTGIWRDVETHTHGRLRMSKPRIVTDLPLEGELNEATVRIHVDVRNYAEETTNCTVSCVIYSRNLVEDTWEARKALYSQQVPDQIGSSVEARFTLPPKGGAKLSLPDVRIAEPQLWWPKQWGSQPLYSANCTAWVRLGSPLPGNLTSDRAPEVNFGIRTVRSELNGHNDTQFYVNNVPFQVLGAGYTSDIFLRFNESKARAQMEYALDMGLNTLRLEGKQEHPAFYDLADELGLMLLAGWECCDKWEGWSYNNEGQGEKWSDDDYEIANKSMLHEAEMMMSHPSVLGFLIGSDFHPDDRATDIYVDALNAKDWNMPIISSASQRGYPERLGSGGMKMEGPYEWVPPNYWSAGKKGGAFGFASELSPGSGTPELESLQLFLNDQIDDLWQEPDKAWLSHMGTSDTFNNRRIFNDALWNRYGAPTKLEDYVLKAQLMDYEAVKAQFEVYAAHWDAERRATGMVYWMLNSAWPSMHWNLFDFYLRPHAAYFAAKSALQPENIIWDYNSSAWLVNRRSRVTSQRHVDLEFLTLNGTTVFEKNDIVRVPAVNPNSALNLGRFSIPDVDEVLLMRLTLSKGNQSRQTITQNVYWIHPRQRDVLDWGNEDEGRESDWYYTPVSSYANLTALTSAPKARLDVQPVSPHVSTYRTVPAPDVLGNSTGVNATYHYVIFNRSPYPAIFVHLFLELGDGSDAAAEPTLPIFWSDNYFTLWPREEKNVTMRSAVDQNQIEGWKVGARGANVKGFTVEGVAAGSTADPLNCCEGEVHWRMDGCDRCE